MLLAIDIGNSLMKFGVIEGTELKDKFAIPTHRDYEADELLFDRLRRVEERFLVIDRVIVSSVVPEMQTTVTDACRELFNVTPTVVDNTWDFRFTIDYDLPSSLGTDRLVNAFAAVAKYGSPVIICSLGTATTVDAVNSSGVFLGGMIAPGMGTMSEALRLKTSNLPQIRIEKPETVIGNSTDSSIRSGIYFGYIGLVSEMIARLRNEIARIDGVAAARIKVIASGGFANLVTPEIVDISVVEENLTLDGLRLLAVGL
ncbi:type III pantothenate kinase [soil metagenome]